MTRRDISTAFGTRAGVFSATNIFFVVRLYSTFVHSLGRYYCRRIRANGINPVSAILLHTVFVRTFEIGSFPLCVNIYTQVTEINRGKVERIPGNVNAINYYHYSLIVKYGP